ncbi:MAG: hypothetical protein PHO01_07950 [Desulfotomaculaceae bacterium]|nr:hypothetical protein [Desulfotomaculaceae bacterium]
MGKSELTTRQETIKRLQVFLQESHNLEPELEQFIRLLIVHLENAAFFESMSEGGECDVGPDSPTSTSTD